MPDEASELWAAFLSLSSRRRTGMSVQPLVWSDLLAWCQLYGTQLTSWELDTLLAMDHAALAALRELQAADGSR